MSKPAPINLDCPTAVDIAAGVLLFGTGVSFVIEDAEAANKLREAIIIFKGLKAGLVGTGSGLVVIGGLSIAYHYFRPQIVSAICND